MTISASADDAVVRDCEETDVPGITAIYAQAVLHGVSTLEVEPPDEREIAARRDFLLSGGYPYLVATVGDVLAGYAYAGVYRPRRGYDSTVETSIYLRDDFQGQGIGSVLLARLIEESEARGFRQMIAVIGDSHNRASIRLHERFGFETIGTLRSVGWKHSRWIDTVILERPLGPGDTTPPTT